VCLGGSELTFSSLGDQVNSEHYLHLDVKWTVPSPIFGGCRQQIKQALAAALSAIFLDFNERVIAKALIDNAHNDLFIRVDFPRVWTRVLDVRDRLSL
jgi:hypothetical protein